MSGPTVAMGTCTHNEARFLAEHLAYHRFVGVDRAYVYLDRCDDGSRDIVDSQPSADAVEVDRTDFDGSLTDFLCWAMDAALDRARAEGYDWLLFLDPDEFACGADETLTERDVDAMRLQHHGDLPTMLERVDPDVDMVQLRTHEIVPAQQSGSEFWCQRHVQRDTTLERDIFDPVAGTTVRGVGFLGHRLGKTLVRTTADDQAGNTHRWTRPGHLRPPDLVPIPSIWRGHHLHFVVTSAAHWREKYRKLADEPATWPRGAPVPFPKQSWKQAAVSMSEAEAQAYYDEWVALSPTALGAAEAQGVIHVDSYVHDVLTHLGAEHAR